jgi:hypothetical protein
MLAIMTRANGANSHSLPRQLRFANLLKGASFLSPPEKTASPYINERRGLRDIQNKIWH